MEPLVWLVLAPALYCLNRMTWRRLNEWHHTFNLFLALSFIYCVSKMSSVGNGSNDYFFKASENESGLSTTMCIVLLCLHPPLPTFSTRIKISECSQVENWVQLTSVRFTPLFLSNVATLVIITLTKLSVSVRNLKDQDNFGVLLLHFKCMIKLSTNVSVQHYYMVWSCASLWHKWLTCWSSWQFHEALTLTKFSCSCLLTQAGVCGSGVDFQLPGTRGDGRGSITAGLRTNFRWL